MPSFDRTLIALLIGVFGGLFLIVSALIQYFDKRESDSQTESAKREAINARVEAQRNAANLLASQNQVISLQEQANSTAVNIAQKASELAESYKKNASKTEELALSYKRNAELQEEFKNQITGGNTIPNLIVYVTHYTSDNPLDASYQLHFILQNSGQYNLNDLSVELTDMRGDYMATHYYVNPTGGNGGGGWVKQSKTEEQVYREWNPSKHFNIGVLQKGEFYNFYVSVIPDYIPSNEVGPEKDSGKVEYFFPVFIKWNSGYLRVQLSLEWIKQNLSVKRISAAINGSEIEPSKHILVQFTN